MCIRRVSIAQLKNFPKMGDSSYMSHLSKSGGSVDQRLTLQEAGCGPDGIEKPDSHTAYHPAPSSNSSQTQTCTYLNIFSVPHWLNRRPDEGSPKILRIPSSRKPRLAIYLTKIFKNWTNIKPDLGKGRLLHLRNRQAHFKMFLNKLFNY